MNRLKSERQARRFSQAEMADKCGVTQSHYSKVERGDLRGNMEFWCLLATEFGRSVEYLTGGNFVDPVETVAPGVERDDLPVGLRALVDDTSLMQTLAVEPAEIQALSALAGAWRSADHINRDGWVGLLLALRAVSR